MLYNKGKNLAFPPEKGDSTKHGSQTQKAGRRNETHGAQNGRRKKTRGPQIINSQIFDP